MTKTAWIARIFNKKANSGRVHCFAVFGIHHSYVEEGSDTWIDGQKTVENPQEPRFGEIRFDLDMEIQFVMGRMRISF